MGGGGGSASRMRAWKQDVMDVMVLLQRVLH